MDGEATAQTAARALLRSCVRAGGAPLGGGGTNKCGTLCMRGAQAEAAQVLLFHPHGACSRTRTAHAAHLSTSIVLQ